MIIEQILYKNNKMLSSYPFKPTLGKLNTPYDLVYEMIKHIPEKLFISNDTKFLDPCAGTGTFIIEILRKLLKYKTFDIAIKQVYMCEISKPISNAFLSNLLPKTKINIPTDNKFINDYFNLIIKEITGGEKTFSDLYYIIHNESIKNQLHEMKLNLTYFIEKYEKISKLESKLFGEVFTPKKLIEEMLNQFPKEIWTNKNLKWLDPAVGIGNFPAIVVEKLMEGLKEEIPSESERYKWIMEEMIYMVDISTKNLFLLYKLFDENNNLKLNVHRGSFLDDSFLEKMKEWNVDKFDVIMGNPPYQHPSNKRWKLWVAFLDKISKMNNKYLIFVTPNAWMNSSGEELSKAKDIILNKGINLVNVDVNHHFNGVGEDIGYYFCDGEERSDITIIKDNNEIIIPNNGEFITSKEDKIKNYIFKKMTGYESFTFLNINTDIRSKLLNGSFSKEKTETNKTRVIHSASNIFYSSDNLSSLQKEGVIINWSGHFYKKNNNKYLFRSIEDVPGRNTKKILTSSEEESINLISYLSSKIVRFFLENKKTSGFNTPLLNIPKVNLDKKFDDDLLYKYFNLTEEEVNFIEKIIKD